MKYFAILIILLNLLLVASASASGEQFEGSIVNQTIAARARAELNNILLSILSLNNTIIDNNKIITCSRLGNLHEAIKRFVSYGNEHNSKDVNELTKKLLLKIYDVKTYCGFTKDNVENDDLIVFVTTGLHSKDLVLKNMKSGSQFRTGYSEIGEIVSELFQSIKNDELDCASKIEQARRDYSNLVRECNEPDTSKTKESATQQ